MPKPPRKHHYVQAQHVRQFTNEDGIVWVFGKDGSRFHGTPEGVFKKKDLNSYDAPHGLDTTFEEYITSIENACWPAFKRIIETERFDPEDTVLIASYLSLSRMRNPTVQTGILQQHQSILDTTARLLDANGKFDDIGPNPIRPRASMTDLLDDGTIVFEVNNAEYLKSVMQMVEPFARLLANGFKWSIVKSERQRVMISDHPLTYLHPGEHPGLYGIVPGGKTCEIAFPISKSIYLLGMWEDGIEDVSSEDIVDELNKRQAIFANRHVASCHNRNWVRSLAMRNRHFGFQTVTDRVGPLNGSYHITRVGVYELPGRKRFKGTHPLERTVSVRRLL